MRKAFTLLEFIVVIALISVMATIIVPRLAQRAPDTDWSAVVQEINNLIFFARQEAISNHRLHRLVFRSQKGVSEIFIEEEDEAQVQKRRGSGFKATSSLFAKTHYEMPKIIEINSVYLGEKDQLLDNGVGYCYIVPDGLVQEVWIRLTRREAERVQKITVKTLPFLGECMYVEGHPKPE